MHQEELISIAIVAGAAMVLGLVFSRIRQPVMVGYIVAGVLLGPSALAIIKDRDTIGLIAEMGVLMLLFLIGMELSLRNFRRVWRLSVAAMAMQVALGLAVALGLGQLLGWETQLALIVGFGLSLSSTAVAIKILEDIGLLRTDVGRTAIGVLIAQDLAVVPMLIVVSEMGADGGGVIAAVAPIVAAVAILVGIVFLMTRRKRESQALSNWVTHDADLAVMTGLSLCFVGAAVTGLVGLSPAYGAFLAGLVVGNTIERPRMIAAVQPVQSALMMVFFLSVGLLLDLQFVVENWWAVLLPFLAVTIGKTAANIGILRVVGEPWRRAWLVGTVLGQVGEFSFVLVAAGLAAGVIDTYAGNLMTSVIVLSLAFTSMLLFTARRMSEVRWLRIRNLVDLIDAIYGHKAGEMAARSGRAAQQAVAVSVTLGDVGRSELDRMMKRMRPDEDGDGRESAEGEEGAEGEKAKKKPAAETPSDDTHEPKP